SDAAPPSPPMSERRQLDPAPGHPHLDRGMVWPGARLMLEGLDEIRWERLHHAFGAATDVPPALRALTSADPEIVREAVHELFGTIWHQGTVYSATPNAVPFLIEILRAMATHEPAGVVWLLAEIAQGQGYYTVHAREPKDAPTSVDLPTRSA